MNSEIVATFFFIILWIAGIVGWVLNIIKIVAWNEAIGMLVARVIGAFMLPLGAVLGYL